MFMLCWCILQFVVFCGGYKLQHCTIFFYLFLKIDFILLYEAEWCSNGTLDEKGKVFPLQARCGPEGG